MGIQIILANEATFNPVAASSTRVNYRGASRNALEFQFSESDDAATYDKLKAAFTESNCATIALVDGDMRTPYEGYVILTEIARKDIMTKPGDNENAPTYEPRMIVTVAERTYQENQLADLQASTDLALISALTE